MFEEAGNKLSIAVDYDDTFTADPFLMCLFINKAWARGHDVYCVSARNNSEGNLQQLRQSLPGGVTIVLCGDCPKREFCDRQGVKIDIWMDDCPDAIIGEHDRLTAAYDEVERLRMLVNECRDQRDRARTDAMVSLNAEMSGLRAEITRLKSLLGIVL